MYFQDRFQFGGHLLVDFPSFLYVIRSDHSPEDEVYSCKESCLRFTALSHRNENKDENTGFFTLEATFMSHTL